MDKQEKQLNMLGLAQRAGRLVSGDDLVQEAIKKNQVYLLVLANDVSQATRQRFEGLADRHDLPLNITFNTDELSQAIGRVRKIMALNDQGMAKRFLSYTQGNEDLYDK